MIPTIIGAGIQAGMGIINNQMAREQQSEARAENYRYGEMAAQNADARTRALYNDFYSPEALLRQYKNAGLSPSMMFGGTPGQGGTNGAQGTGASGLGSLYQPISMLEGAQIANIQAQTEKTKAETRTIDETREGQVLNISAQNKVLLEEAGMKNAETELTKLQAAAQEILNYINNETKESQIEIIGSQEEYYYQLAGKMEYEALNAKIDYDFNKETYKTRKQEYIEQVGKLVAEQIELASRSDLNDQKIKEITTKASQAYLDYLQRQEQILINNKEATTKQHLMYQNYKKLRNEMFEIERNILKDQSNQAVTREGNYLNAAVQMMKILGSMCMFGGM